MGKLSRRRYADDQVDIESLLANLERLKAIEQSGLLDGVSRPELQQLIERLADRLGTKAQISLITEDRQIVPNRAGAPPPESGSNEESLDYSYCKYVVAFRDTLVVSDSHTDDLLANNLSTTEIGLQSYLGTPFEYKGEVIGSLCVFDYTPREWTDEDLEILNASAQELMTVIDGNIQSASKGGKHFRN